MDDDDYGYTPKAPGDTESLLEHITRSEEDFSGAVEASKGSMPVLFLVFFFPALGGLQFGYDIGATSSAFLKNSYLPRGNMQQSLDLSDTERSAITSLSLFGALLGAIAVFFVGDFLSRRGVLMMAAGFFVGGATVTGFAVEFWTASTGRLIYGVGIGFAMHSAPLYIAEISPAAVRGLLISLKECFIVLGILLGYIMGYAFADVNAGWRWVYFISVGPSLLMFVGCFMIPPSPRWVALRALHSNNKEMQHEGHDALTRIRKLSRDETQLEYNEIITSIQQQMLHPFAWKNFVAERALWRGLIIGCGLVAFQQFSGQPSVLYYSSSVFENAGLSEGRAQAVSSVGVAFVKLIMTGFSTALVDRAGRRILLTVGIVLMDIALAVMVITFLFIDTDVEEINPPLFLSLIVIGAMMVYVSGYQVGFGPISWTMISEIFPLHMRSQALSIAVWVNFASNTIVTFTFIPMQSLFGQSGAYAVYFVITLLSLFFTFFLVPETKGRTLEQIESLLEERVLIPTRRRNFPFYW